MKISSRYEEMRLDFIKKIREDSVEILREEDMKALGYMPSEFCYICQETSNKKKIMAIDKGKGFEMVYSIDNSCYAKFKGIYLVKN